MLALQKIKVTVSGVIKWTFTLGIQNGLPKKVIFTPRSGCEDSQSHEDQEMVHQAEEMATVRILGQK